MVWQAPKFNKSLSSIPVVGKKLSIVLIADAINIPKSVNTYSDNFVLNIKTLRIQSEDKLSKQKIREPPPNCRYQNCDLKQGPS